MREGQPGGCSAAAAGAAEVGADAPSANVASLDAAGATSMMRGSWERTVAVVAVQSRSDRIDGGRRSSGDAEGDVGGDADAEERDGDAPGKAARRPTGEGVSCRRRGRSGWLSTPLLLGWWLCISSAPLLPA